MEKALALVFVASAALAACASPAPGVDDAPSSTSTTLSEQVSTATDDQTPQVSPNETAVTGTTLATGDEDHQTTDAITTDESTTGTAANEQPSSDDGDGTVNPEDGKDGTLPPPEPSHPKYPNPEPQIPPPRG